MPELHIPTTPAIDAEAAGKLLRRIEAHHDMTGWHHEGQLWVYVVYERGDVVIADYIGQVMQTMGEPVRNARYVAQPMLPPRMFAAARNIDNPTEGLRRFALNLAYGETEEFGAMAEQAEAFRSLLKQPGIVGYAACHEAYGWKASVMPRPLPAPGKLQDDPDARELRVAYLVDINDQAHRVVRWRDEPAELTAGQIHGNVTTSLRILADITAGRVPPADEFLTRYPSAGLHVDLA